MPNFCGLGRKFPWWNIHYGFTENNKIASLELIGTINRVRMCTYTNVHKYIW